MENNTFHLLLNIALGVCLIGFLYQFFTWFSRNVGSESESYGVWKRIWMAFQGGVKVFFSPRLFILGWTLAVDVILQIQVLRKSFIRWFMHLLIYLSFFLLLFMHAMDELVSEAIFADYYSTLDPFMFLRNVFGALVLMGVLIALYRRFKVHALRSTYRMADIYALGLLGVIMLSGFLLESTKITSEANFNRMVSEYSDLTAEELPPLRYYWTQKFGSVFEESVDRGDETFFESGKELHADNCAACHSRPTSAFISYPLSRATVDFAVFLDDIQTDKWLYYIHVLACFIGLAFMPFTKFRHILTSPLSLIVNAVSDSRKMSPVNKSTRRLLDLSACTHCGTCSQNCSVMPSYQIMGNPTILPSEKLIALARLTRTGYRKKELAAIFQEGSFICTSCHKCTDVCPVGIDLQDLWFASKKGLAEKGLADPHIVATELAVEDWETLNPKETDFAEITYQRPYQKRSLDFDTLYRCIQCQRCSAVCPVITCNVEGADGPDLTPQQVMNFVRMGRKDMALGSRMVWNCTTCYQCQENCPQGIKITDIIHELRHVAYARLQKKSIQGSSI